MDLQQKSDEDHIAELLLKAKTLSVPANCEDADLIKDIDVEMEMERRRATEEENRKLIKTFREIDIFNVPFAGCKAAGSKEEIDYRSVYVGNVDYGATESELENHFHGCGPIVRISIQRDKYSSNPKGFAYIEFKDKDSVQLAMTLDDSLFRGRQIKVMPKRTNKHGISTTNRRPKRFMGRGGNCYRGRPINSHCGVPQPRPPFYTSARRRGAYKGGPSIYKFIRGQQQE